MTRVLLLVPLTCSLLAACGSDDSNDAAGAGGSTQSAGAAGVAGATNGGQAGATNGGQAGATTAGAGGDAGATGLGGSTPSGGAAGSAGQGSAGAGSSGAAGGAGGNGATSCGTYAPGDALAVCAATYLGGVKDDAIGGVDFAKDGSVLVGMTLPGQDFGVAPVVLNGGTDGAVVRLAANGQTVLSVTRLGKQVTALAVDPSTGNVAIAGDFGVALLDPSASALVWAKAAPGGTAKRISAQGGLVGVVAGTTATLFANDGTQLSSVANLGKEVNGVAVDAPNQALVVTGYKQDDGDKCQQYKSTFVRSYDVAGKLRWKSYDWTKADVASSSDCADSVGLGLAVGRDGKLYYAGKSDGGNTVHAKDPRDLSKKGPVVSFDQFNQAYGFKGANSIGFYARFSLGDGTIDKGQFVVARKGDGGPNTEGNAATPSAIAADEEGNVFVTGTAAFRIAGQDNKTVAGQKVGAYASYEGFLLIVSPDFGQRLSWTSFSAGGAADGRAVAASGQSAIYAGAQSGDQAAKGSLITASALASKPQGGSDGYLVVLPAP
jgi:hypothetical protein